MNQAGGDKGLEVFTAPGRVARQGITHLDGRLQVGLALRKDLRFLKDLLACPCGGRLQRIAVITDPDLIETVAAAIILSNQTLARAPPDLAVVGTQPRLAPAAGP